MIDDSSIGQDLSADLQESYHKHKRAVVIKKLAAKMDITFGQIAKLTENAEHGDVVKTITLQDIFDECAPKTEEAAQPPKPAAKPSAKKGLAKTAAPKGKKAAKATPAPKKAAAAKKTAKAAPAPKAKKTAGAKPPKADKGKKKPRLDYDKGCKEILAALKAAGEPVGRGAIESATGYTGVQVRTFCKKLAEQGKIEVLGSGGRSTRYKLP
jgi:hypothetical protein